MAGKRDYYEVLGVSRDATEKEICEAYRRLALKYHPDRNPDDEDAIGKFKEAAEAFDVLNNRDKRAIYDRYGHDGLEGRGAAPHFHDLSEILQAFGSILGGGLFGDLFGGMGDAFGGGPARGGHRGADIRCQIELDLLEAARGVSKTVEFARHARCSDCKGSGARPGSRPETCRYCGGHGRVVQSNGIFAIRRPCPACHGEGRVVRDPCPQCSGSGFVRQRIRREIKIPPGVDGTKPVRVRGEGEPSPDGGPAGNLECLIRVREHPLFQRHGRDLVCQIPISYAQAALGATIEVPTLDGREELPIPRGTQNGAVFRIPGQGMPGPRRAGDLIVQVYIEVPRRLSAEHERLLRQLAEIEDEHVTPERKSFFARLKEYFQSE